MWSRSGYWRQNYDVPGTLDDERSIHGAQNVVYRRDVSKDVAT